MSPLRKFTFALALLGLLVAGAAFAQDDTDSENPVVLRAGGAEETLEDFEARFEIALRGLAAQQGVELTPEVRAQLADLAPQFLEQRAREVALVQEARERGIEVDEEEIDARIEEIRAGAPDEEAFQNLLEQSGIGSEEMLRTLVREDALVGALQAEIEAVQEVDPADVEAAYEERIDEFGIGEQVCASHILVETEEEAEEALEEIRGGTPFEEVAAERGTDATSAQGGELGCFERGQMVPEFEEAVFDPEAEVGEPFGPVETQFGHHVILVSERQEPQTLAFDEVREALVADLAEEAVQEELVSVLEESEIETFPERLPTPEPAGEDGGPETEPDAAPADGEQDAPAAPEGEDTD